MYALARSSLNKEHIFATAISPPCARWWTSSIILLQNSGVRRAAAVVVTYCIQCSHPPSTILKFLYKKKEGENTSKQANTSTQVMAWARTKHDHWWALGRQRVWHRTLTVAEAWHKLGWHQPSVTAGQRAWSNELAHMFFHTKIWHRHHTSSVEPP